MPNRNYSLTAETQRLRRDSSTMIRPTKPRLLVLTSSFPNAPEDETCGYIRDFVRSLSAEFDVQVLAPPDQNACDWPADNFTILRSPSLLPRSVEEFQATRDFNDLPVRSIAARVGLLFSLSIYFITALKLANRSDAICSHWLVPAGAIGAAIARLTGKPHVVVEHSGAMHLLSRVTGGRLIARFVVSASERVVAVSGDLRSKLVALCPQAKDKVLVIPMGVEECKQDDGCELESESSRFHGCIPPTGSSKPVVLFVGRLTRVKGVDVLLRAMRHGVRARLVIAGDGDQRSHLESLARDLSIDATFVGQVDSTERNRLLGDCTALVIPSRVLADGRTEGTPVVCLEAMAADRPVIAARVGGLAEIIVDGQNGLLFEPGDEVALAAKLNLLIRDSALRDKLSMNARLTAADHSWTRLGRRFAETIKASMNRNDRVFDDQELDCSLAGR